MDNMNKEMKEMEAMKEQEAQEEERQTSRSRGRRRKNRLFTSGLAWLPLSTGMIAIFTCILTYVVGVLNGHIMKVLPYVSDAGMMYPESSIFSMFMNITVSLLGFTTIVRYYLLTECLPKLKPRVLLRYMRVNKVSVVFGFLSSIGLAILCNFPNRKHVGLVESAPDEDENLTVHLIGATMCFLSGVVYCFMHAWLSFKSWSTITSPYVCILRLTLAALSAMSLIMVILFGSGLRWNATADNPVLHYRRISAAFEWILVAILNSFFMTFGYEFSHIRLIGKLHHWTGSHWGESTSLSSSSSTSSTEGASSIGSATPATESLNEEDLEVKSPCLGHGRGMTTDARYTHI